MRAAMTLDVAAQAVIKSNGVGISCTVYIIDIVSKWRRLAERLQSRGVSG